MVHCGNAPKMERVIDLTVALAKKDPGRVKQLVSNGFVWRELDGSEVLNYENIGQELVKRPDVKKLTVSNALSHGNGAMCEGVLSFGDGDNLDYCAIAKFTSTAKDALIKEIHFYFAKQ